MFLHIFVCQSKNSHKVVIAADSSDMVVAVTAAGTTVATAVTTRLQPLSSLDEQVSTTNTLATYTAITFIMIRLTDSGHTLMNNALLCDVRDFLRYVDV